MKKPHKRYLLFCPYPYMASGGLDDMEGDFDSPVEAVEFLNSGQVSPSADATLYDRVEGVKVDIEVDSNVRPVRYSISVKP